LIVLFFYMEYDVKYSFSKRKNLFTPEFSMKILQCFVQELAWIGCRMKYEIDLLGTWYILISTLIETAEENYLFHVV